MSQAASPPEWENEYREREDLYEQLATEAEFALEATTRQSGIKTHSITSRVKTVESLHLKAQDKELKDPLVEAGDLVGARVVVLFLNDLPRLDGLIKGSFMVHSVDDKISSEEPTAFGYMSIHYQVSLGDQHKGPRYDALKDLSFEIQTRTVVMDAWANVSHYLDYKGASSVPEPLRRDFFALSGLFYVADQHFEMFAARSGEAQEEAKKDVQGPSKEGIDVNLDTTEAFLRERFPDREHSSRSGIAEFVNEIRAVGYDDISKLEKAIDHAESVFGAYEQQREALMPGERFTDLGAARISLGIADKTYAEARYPGDEEFLEFNAWE